MTPEQVHKSEALYSELKGKRCEEWEELLRQLDDKEVARRVLQLLSGDGSKEISSDEARLIGKPNEWGAQAQLASEQSVLMKRTLELESTNTARNSANVDFVPGQLVVERYRILSKLGEGAFGNVWAASDERLQRSVALKVMKEGSTSWSTERFLAEARTLARVEHPHIVPIFDVVSCLEIPLLVVSKLIVGQSLAELMRAEQPLSALDSAKLIEQVARALHCAHECGVVHRDIKPANILVDRQSTAYVCDFGLALRSSEYGQGPTLAGTIPYMSPEQARGESDKVDGRSDIYSLGVVLYELLAGRRPFEGANEEMLRSIANDEVRPPRTIVETIPQPLEDIALKALAKKVVERYQTAGEMADALRQFLDNDGDGQSELLDGSLVLTPIPPGMLIPIPTNGHSLSEPSQNQPLTAETKDEPEQEQVLASSTAHPYSVISAVGAQNCGLLMVPLLTLLATHNWTYALMASSVGLLTVQSLIDAVSDWWMTDMTVTTTRVTARSPAKTLDVPIEHIERVRVEQDWVGRSHDFGDIHVVSEGTASRFRGVRSPQALKSAIEAARRQQIPSK